MECLPGYFRLYLSGEHNIFQPLSKGDNIFVLLAYPWGIRLFGIVRSCVMKQESVWGIYISDHNCLEYKAKYCQIGIFRRVSTLAYPNMTFQQVQYSACLFQEIVDQALFQIPAGFPRLEVDITCFLNFEGRSPLASGQYKQSPETPAQIGSYFCLYSPGSSFPKDSHPSDCFLLNNSILFPCG